MGKTAWSRRGLCWRIGSVAGAGVCSIVPDDEGRGDVKNLHAMRSDPQDAPPHALLTTTYFPTGSLTTGDRPDIMDGVRLSL
mmetsp:Transcript_6561/g.16535  ORF Transcript_6561/g.16535 Transcript_6561/m.16535 type:complete len:82 (-) Transcript_6561:390-635(-)